MTPAYRLASKSRQLVNRLITKREVGNVHSLDVEQTRLEQEILMLAAVVDGTTLQPRERVS